MRLTGGDTMNFWIQGSRNELMETLKLVNVLLINDGEAKMLAGEGTCREPRKKFWRWDRRRWSSSMANTGPRFSSGKAHLASAIILSARPRCPLMR